MVNFIPNVVAFEILHMETLTARVAAMNFIPNVVALEILHMKTLRARLATSMNVSFFPQTRETQAPGVMVEPRLPWCERKFDSKKARTELFLHG